jgi:hypothetical protein
LEKQNLKKYIFDPLSTIIKLSILSNKPNNSKISIKNNIINIQEDGFFQGLVRYYWLYNKDDLHYLAIPIFLACEKYLKKDSIEKIPEIKILFITAQNGLLKLMQTYSKYPLIIHCLQYYHTIINTKLNNEETINLFNNFKTINKMENLINYNKTLMDFYTPDLLNKFYDIWTDSKIKIVIDMTKYLLGESQAAQYARSIEIFMIPVDNRVCSYILEI